MSIITMNRRNFLNMLGLGAAAPSVALAEIAKPKEEHIFDSRKSGIFRFYIPDSIEFSVSVFDGITGETKFYEAPCKMPPRGAVPNPNWAVPCKVGDTITLGFDKYLNQRTTVLNLGNEIVTIQPIKDNWYV